MLVNLLLRKYYRDGKSAGMEHLRKWRLSLPENRTLDAAGRMLGVSAVQLSRYESGVRRIPAERVPAISRITGIPPEQLRPDIFGVEPQAVAS